MRERRTVAACCGSTSAPWTRVDPAEQAGLKAGNVSLALDANEVFSRYALREWRRLGQMSDILSAIVQALETLTNSEAPTPLE